MSFVRPHALTASMFFGTVAWQFVHVSCRSTSRRSARTTSDAPLDRRDPRRVVARHRLHGAVLGRWAERGDPKRLYIVVEAAPVFPIVFSRIAQHASGEAIGFVNSARIGAAFVGPVVATSVLAHSSAVAVDVVLAAVTLAIIPLAAGVGRPRPAPRPA